MDIFRIDLYLQAICYTKRDPARKAALGTPGSASTSGLASFMEESFLAHDEFPCFILEGEHTTCSSYIWQTEFETTNSLLHTVSPSVEVTTVEGGPFEQARYLSSRKAVATFLAISDAGPLMPLYDEGIRAGGRSPTAEKYNFPRQYRRGFDSTEAVIESSVPNGPNLRWRVLDET